MDATTNTGSCAPDEAQEANNSKLQQLDTYENANSPSLGSQEEDDSSASESSDKQETGIIKPEELLPPLSRGRYITVYYTFLSWRNERQTTSFDESLFMDYFLELSKKLKPTSLWSQYSLLKSTMKINHGVDLGHYSKLLDFIRKQAKGYKSTKAKVLTLENVQNFLTKASDREYLAVKVVSILGILGACRSYELISITTEDVEDHGDLISVKIPAIPGQSARAFNVEGDLYKIVKKYRALRPTKTTSNRFFVNYQKGKCTKQVIGKNKIMRMPKQIAEYLKLPKPDSYTGSSFRRTATNAGGNLDGLKHLGGWKLAEETDTTLNEDELLALFDSEEGNMGSELLDTSEPNNSIAEQLPVQSRSRYMIVYNAFLKWQRAKKTSSFSENVFLEYFNELSEKLKPSSLWSTYSMLKATLKINNEADMTQYTELLAFIKKKAHGYEKKKSKGFTMEEIEHFLAEAPDHEYLVMKVALILGVIGACSCYELISIRVEDVENHGNMLLIKIPTAKAEGTRSFVVDGKFYSFVLKYQAMRPKDAPTNRFFLKYHKGRCTKQVIGKNKLMAMPKLIAEYLKLPNLNDFTGHSFRRTSATILTNAGFSLVTLKRRVDRKSLRWWQRDTPRTHSVTRNEPEVCLPSSTAVEMNGNEVQIEKNHSLTQSQEAMKEGTSFVPKLEPGIISASSTTIF